MGLLHSSQELPEAANSSSSLASICSKGNSDGLESPLELRQFAIIPDVWAMTRRKKWSHGTCQRCMRKDEPGNPSQCMDFWQKGSLVLGERTTNSMKSSRKSQS